MAVSELLPPEERLVERYISVLDFVSRCAQAVDEGNTYYLWDKAGQLEDAARALHAELGSSNGRPPVRPGALAAAVRVRGRHYRAGRLLHPVRVPLTSTQVRSMLLSVAGMSGLQAADATVIDAIARDAQAIAGRSDVRPEQVARVLCALGRWEVRDVE